MIGITAFGTYVPVYRLGRNEIARAWNTNDLGGERTVAKHDEDIEARTFALNGELPVNTDGGLKCFGHPLGASGLRMQYEVYKQLQEKAGSRQVKDPRLGLTHNFGGGIGCIAITGNEMDRR